MSLLSLCLPLPSTEFGSGTACVGAHLQHQESFEQLLIIACRMKLAEGLSQTGWD